MTNKHDERVEKILSQCDELLDDALIENTDGCQKVYFLSTFRPLFKRWLRIGLTTHTKEVREQTLAEVREEREEWKTYHDQVESIFNWLQGENGDFPDLSQKPHYSFRSDLRRLRATLTPPTTNNKN